MFSKSYTLSCSAQHARPARVSGYGTPQKRQCLKWVNCRNGCYCAQWAKLLEESSEAGVTDRDLGVPEPESEAPEEIVQVEVTDS